MKSHRIFLLLAGVVVLTLARAADLAQPVATLTRPAITGIANVALYAHELPKSRAFYQDFLGYAEPSRTKPGVDPRRALIKINEVQEIELLPEPEAGSDRLQHVGLFTNDAARLRQYLRAKGYPVPAETGHDGSGGRRFTVLDPDGRQIEFVQSAPDSPPEKIHAKEKPATRIAPRIRHAGFMVADLAASLKFYRDLLGFEETWRGSSDDKILSWVNLKVPDGDEYIELMLYDPARPPNREFRGVLNHICLEAEDVAAAERILRTRSLPTGSKVTSPMRAGKNGKRQINCYDPDGTRTEIMEPATLDGQPVPSSSAPPPGHPPPAPTPTS